VGKVIPGRPHPSKLSDHAIDRWHERWRPAWSRKAAEIDLKYRLPTARFVIWDRKNMVSFWDLPKEDGYAPRLEVDMEGEVKTVHPRGATQTSRRPRR
jgi:hypothetical protein